MAHRLSLLDQSPISQGMSVGDALQNSIDLARFVDRLGFARYWVAEHHDQKAGRGRPRILIGPIAAATTNVQSEAERDAPHPAESRRDLRALERPPSGSRSGSVGRAAGHRSMTVRASARPPRRCTRRLPEQLTELLCYSATDPAQLSIGPVPTSDPASRLRPATLVVGSSPQAVSGRRSSGCHAFADFIYPAGGAAACRYRESFTLSHAVETPT